MIALFPGTMLRHILLLLASLSAERCYAGKSLSALSRISGLLQKLCPGANVCPENQTFRAPEYTFPHGYGSCCVECSCSTNCEKSGNCCFPQNKSQQHQTEKGRNVLQKEHTCLFPVTPEPQELDKVQFQSYNMVSSIQTNFYDDSNPVSSCGEEHVAPWGSLYPVFSAASGLIYKNMVCAIADGVNDGIVWDALLTCTDFINGIILDPSNFVLGSDRHFLSGLCAVNFIYRGNIENIESLKCYKDLKTTCPDSEFKIPDGIGASKEDVIEMCTSGLESPYRRTKMYANVFCHICDNQYFKTNFVCREYEGPGKLGQIQGFVGLLDQDFLTEIWQKTIRATPEFPVACGIVKSGSCKRVICPSGQLRARSGDCRYPCKLWYDQEYTVHINLTSETAINLTGVFNVQSSYLNQDLPDFISPWPKGWYISSIFTYSDVLDGGYRHASFHFVMKRVLSAVQPKQIVQTIQKMTKRQWFLQHKNATYALKSQISSHSYIDFVTLERDSNFFFGNISESINRVLYRRSKFPGNEFVITKLYFCDQVELTSNEITLGPYQTTLFNKITKRYLFYGEFALVWNSTNGDERVRICIEDADMHKTLNNSGACWFSEIVCVLLISVIILLFDIESV